MVTLKVLEEVERCPAKTAISAIFPKLRKIGEMAEFAKIN